jgi:hypothetical protein
VESFVAFLCIQPFVAVKHTKLHAPVEVELALSRRIGWSQQRICANPQKALRAAKSAAGTDDVRALANQGFIFFKVQLAHVRIHRSGMGKHAHVFPLEQTELLSFGHFYLVDPVATSQLNVHASAFAGTCLEDELVASTLAPKSAPAPTLARSSSSADGGWLRRLTDGPALLYPTHRSDWWKSSRDTQLALLPLPPPPLPATPVPVNPTRWMLFGPGAMRGLALRVLTEACRMHPSIGAFLLRAATAPRGSPTDLAIGLTTGLATDLAMCSPRILKPDVKGDAATLRVLDVLLTKVVRVQGLLPGGISTANSTFVRNVGTE